MTHELVINGESYKLNFGMGFVRKIQPKHKQEVNGEKVDNGLQTAIAMVIDGDLEYLEEVLLLANEKQQPRLTQAILDLYIEDEKTDIDELFDMVLGFFEMSNCTKRTYRDLKALIDAQREAAADQIVG